MTASPSPLAGSGLSKCSTECVFETYAGDHPAHQQRAAAHRTPALMNADVHSGKDIAKYLGVSRVPLYRYMNDKIVARP